MMFIVSLWMVSVTVSLLLSYIAERHLDKRLRALEANPAPASSAREEAWADTDEPQ